MVSIFRVFQMVKSLPRFILYSILALSLLLNYFLCYKLIGYYKALNLLRLDPIETKRKDDNLSLNRQGSLIFLFGDSRIAKWHPELTLEGCTVINKGVGGQTTAQLTLRLEQDILVHSPDLVVLQAGVNDLKIIGVFPEKEKHIFSKCKDNLYGIIQSLQEKKIPVLVLTIFPTGKPGIVRSLIWKEKINDKISEINASLLKIKDNKILVVDCDAILGKSGYIRTEFAKDMLHLNEEGYAHLNNALRPHLIEFLDNRR